LFATNKQNKRYSR